MTNYTTADRAPTMIEFWDGRTTPEQWVPMQFPPSTTRTEVETAAKYALLSGMFESARILTVYCGFWKIVKTMKLTIVETEVSR